MLVSNFNTDFENYVQNQDLEKATNTLLEELAKILVSNKSDFVDMLEESGIEADETMSKGQLIELFTTNTDNKKMLVGASLLANSYNKKLSFDGEEEISDDSVKVGYALLNENFNGDEYDEVQDEEFSYIVPILAGTVRGGVNLWRNNRQRQGKSAEIKDPTFNKVIQMRQDLARRQMERAAIQQQKVALEQQRISQEEAKKKRKRTTTYVVIGTVILTAIIGAIIYIKTKK
jgi:hypothetical protein